MKVRKLFPQYELPRATGRTTAICLMTLARAIHAPGQPVPIRDHWRGENSDSMALAQCKQMAEVLGLQHMRFERKQNECFVIFDLFEDKRTTDIVWVHPSSLDEPDRAYMHEGTFSQTKKEGMVGMIDIETFLRCRNDDALFESVKLKLAGGENGDKGT